MSVRVEVPSDGVKTGWPPVALRETCRVAVDRTVPLWPYHRRRLDAGGCGETLLAAVDGAVRDALAQLSERISSRTRLTVVVGAEAGISVVVQRRLSSLDAPAGVHGVPIETQDLPSLPPGAAKPADRAYWDDAQRLACAAGGHQAVIVGPGGTVIDGGTATILVRNGALVATPPAPPAVAGVARAWLFDNAARLSVIIEEREVSLGELERAEEIVYLNAYGGARADVRGEDELARAIQRELDRLWGCREG